MCCFVAFGLFGTFSRGWPNRVSPQVLQLADVAWPDPRIKICLAELDNLIPPENACEYGAKVSPTSAVWGDSHADALIDMIGEVANRHNQSVKFIGNDGCPPIVGVRLLGPGGKECYSQNEQTINYILREKDLHTVILIARWTLYLDGFNRDFGPAERQQTTKTGPLLSNEVGAVMDRRSRQEQFSKLVRSTVERLTVGGKTVVLVYPIPETGYDVPRTLAKLVLVGRDPSQFTRPKDYYVRRQKFVFDVFDELGPTIIRIRPDLRLCDDLKCIVYANGKSLYFDDDHLSRAGTNYLSDMFDPLFKRNGLTETAKP